MKFIPIQRFTIYGNSMLPTFQPGQDILCFNWAYIFSKPKIGELVVIRKNGKDMVKRIQKIQNHQYFVEGDNKFGSTDSRNFGWINKSEIVGKVIMVVR